MTRSPITRRSVLRATAGAGALAATAAVTAACGSGGDDTTSQPLTASSSSGPLTGSITVWSRSGDLFKVFDAAIKKFTAANPQVTVDHQQVDIDAKLANTLISGAGVPDGSFWDDAKIAGQAEHLYDLTALISPYRERIAPQKLSVNTVDGKVYGVPWDLNPGLLYYREDLLQDAGVDPAGLATYDDLLTAARKLQERNGKAKPIHLDADPFLGQLWLEMLANQQGTSMSDDQGKLRLDSDEYRRILTWIKQAVDGKLVSHNPYLKPADIAGLEDGTQALVPWAIWWDFAPQTLLSKTKGKWKAAPLPAWTPGGARSGAMGGSSFVIPAKAKNPELAWRLYEFMALSDDGIKAVYGTSDTYPGGLNTSVPAYLPALDAAKPLFQPLPALGDQDLWKVAVDASKTIPAAAPIPAWWAKSVDYLGNNLQRLIQGQMSPDDVIAESTKQIQKNLVDRA